MNVNHRVHKSPPLVNILSEMNTSNALAHHIITEQSQPSSDLVSLENYPREAGMQTPSDLDGPVVFPPPPGRNVLVTH
jgi:hypothetical protein